MPWKCEDERHGYEKCQYDECVCPSPFLAPPPSMFIPASTDASYVRRMKELSKMKKEAAEADE